MKYVLFLVVMLSLNAKAQEFYRCKMGEFPDHLSPLRYPASQYDQLVREMLVVTEGQYGRFLVKPSFRAEYSVSVDAEVAPADVGKDYRSIKDEDRLYVLTLTRANKSIWGAMPRDDEPGELESLEVIRVDRSISFELAVAIQRSWGRMIQLTRYPSQVLVGSDGSNYEFSVWVWAMGFIYGKTWSPDGGLRLGIVELGEDLVQLAENTEMQEAPLLQKLRDFEAQLPNP
ncbi:hypothetical protein [Cerasicoccus frondis]|uniref:hypothetical protein n=1 Tax=Cerasicoccus frondis TaxID=490090 RepID=UPI00285256CF|nr:hypothetical protein [Cerasicoccus frondis]